MKHFIGMALQNVSSLICNDGFYDNPNGNTQFKAFKKEWTGNPGGGGGVLGFSFAGYVPLASQSPFPIIVFFVASYRPHLSHFWENVIFAILTESLSIYASTSFWTGGFVLLCKLLILKLWFQERNVKRGDCYI